MTLEKRLQALEARKTPAEIPARRLPEPPPEALRLMCENLECEEAEGTLPAHLRATLDRLRETQPWREG